MAITYPLTLATFWDVLQMPSQPFDLANYEAAAISGGGGFLTTVRAKPRWSGSVTLDDASTLLAADVEGLVGLLNGSVNSFQAYDRSRPYPKADPSGTTLGASSVVVNTISTTNTIKLGGLPAGYVLSVGDYISIPSRMYLGQVVEATTANGSGISPTAFTIRPYLPASVVVTDAVVLAKPYGFFKMVPGTLRSFGKAAGISSGGSFDFLQVLQ